MDEQDRLAAIASLGGMVAKDERDAVGGVDHRSPPYDCAAKSYGAARRLRRARRAHRPASASCARRSAPEGLSLSPRIGRYQWLTRRFESARNFQAEGKSLFTAEALADCAAPWKSRPFCPSGRSGDQYRLGSAPCRDISGKNLIISQFQFNKSFYQCNKLDRQTQLSKAWPEP